MKLRKWIALALSAVMAVGMLTACGGGGTGGSISISQVNKLVQSADSEITVQSSEKLDDEVQALADQMEEKNALLSTIAMNYDLWDAMDYPSVGLGNVTIGGVYVLSEDVIERGGDTASIATLLGLSTSNLASLGTIDTPEGVLAAAVLAIDGGLDTYVDENLSTYVGQTLQQYLQGQASSLISGILNSLVSGIDLEASSYAVSGARMKVNDQNYWVLAVEVAVGAAASATDA